MRLIITGYARHGKDTVCEMIRDRFGLEFVSSSYFVASKAVRPWLEARGIHYKTFDEMYADRVNRRSSWKQAISEYNTPDPSRLGRELFESGNDIYCGLRDIRELKALMRLQCLKPLIDRQTPSSYVDFTIWVDALKRLPPEPETSITIKQSDCMFTLDNNGTLNDLSNNVNALWAFLTKGELE